MVSRASISDARCFLSPILSRILIPSTGLMQSHKSPARFVHSAKEAEDGEGSTTKIYVAPPKKSVSYRDLGFTKGPSLTSLSETKCASPTFDSLQSFSADFSEVFTLHQDIYDHQYFSAYSLKDDGTISTSPSYYIYPPKKDFLCTGSCSGLLHFQNKEYDNLVWNPKTNEFKIFPLRSVEQLPDAEIYDPADACSMWFDESSGECKVLQLGAAHKFNKDRWCINKSFYMELYSLKANSYKKLDCPEFDHVTMRGFCVNGVFYGHGHRIGEEYDVVLTFDFSTETVSTIPYPPGILDVSDTDTMDMPDFNICYLEYKGMVGFFTNEGPPRGRRRLELWVWNNNGSWTKESVFHSNGVAWPEVWVWNNGSWTKESVFHSNGVARPLWFSKNGELLYFASIDGEILLFNRSTRKIEHLGVFHDCYMIPPFPVKESSFQLDRISDVEEKEEVAGVVRDKKPAKDEEEDGDMIDSGLAPA